MITQCTWSTMHWFLVNDFNMFAYVSYILYSHQRNAIWSPKPKRTANPTEIQNLCASLCIHSWKEKSVPGYLQDAQSCTTFTCNPVLCPLKINVISVTSLITSVTTLWYITWMYKDELNSFTILFIIIITLIYS